ncbi:hypothetical protein FEM48_Zijuj04G0067100 [Ziziphus jujuba var. spinosa]|uniref:Rapid ALkalinization Factor n=1 Tax=Ziziphus jujuba var. spinosa TaxID=714518 RepID=A0A978VID8_ZIZJJ|nr:hypothetical protein FEM48_Zijuj04G0067100 [Ziziphus jujuba var. spinosa]
MKAFLILCILLASILSFPSVYSRQLIAKGAVNGSSATPFCPIYKRNCHINVNAPPPPKKGCNPYERGCHQPPGST